jgi:hypothetical protein
MCRGTGVELEPFPGRLAAGLRRDVLGQIGAGGPVLDRAGLVGTTGGRDRLVDLPGTRRDLRGDSGRVLELVDLLLERTHTVTRFGQGRLLGVVQVTFAVLSVRDEPLNERVAFLELGFETPDHGVVGVRVHTHLSHLQR